MKSTKANCGASVPAHMGKKPVKAAKGGLMSIGGVKKMDEPAMRKGGMIAGIAKGAKKVAKGELPEEKKAVGARKGGMIKTAGKNSGY